jgi:signal transduction histidine kinase
MSLTLFYLSIVVVFNLFVTLSVRVYAEHEFLQSDGAQFTAIQQWAERSVNNPGRDADVDLADMQSVQDTLIGQRLNDGLLIINLLALGVGGILSYWFAGRTLKPLEEAHEAQVRFTADASHEMKTPLANMRLENEVFLRQKQFSEEEARAQLISNLEEVQRLERLTSGLLTLHQYGRDALQRSVIKARDITKEAMVQLAASAVDRKIKVKMDLIPAKVVGDQGSLVQLLSIVLDNAFKYGGAGTMVLVSGRKKGRRYVLTVADQGPGIMPQDMLHIFDRLYRGDRSRSKVAGYGLGLSLAKEIASANGAFITVRNNPGGGACFDISLELAP